MNAAAAGLRFIVNKESIMIHIAKAVLAALAFLPILGWAEPVDINTADAATLARELKGIGPARAEAIIAWREDNGPFRSTDELALVRGISERVLEENRERMVASSPDESD